MRLSQTLLHKSLLAMNHVQSGPKILKDRTLKQMPMTPKTALTLTIVISNPLPRSSLEQSPGLLNPWMTQPILMSRKTLPRTTSSKEEMTKVLTMIPPRMPKVKSLKIALTSKETCHKVRIGTGKTRHSQLMVSELGRKTAPTAMPSILNTHFNWKLNYQLSPSL